MASNFVSLAKTRHSRETEKGKRRGTKVGFHFTQKWIPFILTLVANAAFYAGWPAIKHTLPYHKFRKQYKGNVSQCLGKERHGGIRISLISQKSLLALSNQGTKIVRNSCQPIRSL